jgi:hypothetical protein
MRLGQNNIPTFVSIQEVSDIMDSNKFAETKLPHPQTSSPAFTEEVETLVDAFDDIINSMVMKLAISSGKSLEEIQAEIDDIDEDDDTFDQDTLSDEEETLHDDDAHPGEPVDLEEHTEDNSATHVYFTFPFGETRSVEAESSEQQVDSDNSVSDEDSTLPQVGTPILEERGRSRTRSPPGSRRNRDRTLAWRGRGICHRRQSI